MSMNFFCGTSTERGKLLTLPSATSRRKMTGAPTGADGRTGGGGVGDDDPRGIAIGCAKQRADVTIVAEAQHLHGEDSQHLFNIVVLFFPCSLSK
jgi:hypothetical protein